MKAAWFDRYGPPEVLRIVDIPKPVPGPKQILIRIVAATVTLGDCEIRAFRMIDWVWLPMRLVFGIFRPRFHVLGMEFAGEVAEKGDAVTRFAVGDRVFGSTSFSMGAHAEFKVLPETGAIAKIPEGVGFAEAAGIPTGGFNGLHFVRNAAIRPGERVLVIGGGGAIGSFALQFAKRAGAHVTATDRVDKLEMMRGIGADVALDYRTEDALSGGARYDVIVDVPGKSDFDRCMAALDEGGRYVLTNPNFMAIMRALIANRRQESRRVQFKFAGEPVEDLEEIAALVAKGEVRVSIDRHMPLEKIAEAHDYVEAGNKKGVLVIDIGPA